MLAPIFRSEGQARLLVELLLTGDELSISDLAERAGLAYATAHREVGRLVNAGILASRTVGRSRLVRANNDDPLTRPLREVLAVAAGPVPALRGELAPIEGIVSAFIYGSFAARMRGVPGKPPADIDIMVVGSPSAEEIYEACDRVQSMVHRPVNPTILSLEELHESSGFVETVRAQPVVPILGEALWQ